LIVDDGTGQENGAMPAMDRNARDILRACVAEAERQAALLAEVDLALGRLLCDRAEASDAVTLQSLDLVRQEAEGLSRILRRIADLPGLDAELDAAELAKCLPVARQRARVTS
jgi:hypothetical protein